MSLVTFLYTPPSACGKRCRAGSAVFAVFMRSG
jgi:hypothetical protein